MWKLGTYRLTKVVFGNMGFSAAALVRNLHKRFQNTLSRIILMGVLFLPFHACQSS